MSEQEMRPQRPGASDRQSSAPPPGDPTSPGHHGSTANERSALRMIAGAACCVSGIALVIHILTGMPLWLAFAGLGFTVSVGAVLLEIADPVAMSRLRGLAARGVIVGAVGTVAYDSSRWMVVQVGGMHSSPFAALPLFGQAMLGAGSSGDAVTVVGIGYHILNGVAFGTAYVIWLGNRSWWWGIVFALGLEAFMLALYPGWLHPRSVAELTQISIVGHLAYGTTLGLTDRWLASRQRPGQAGL